MFICALFVKMCTALEIFCIHFVKNHLKIRKYKQTEKINQFIQCRQNYIVCYLMNCIDRMLLACNASH